jgi:threonine dehydratase
MLSSTRRHHQPRLAKPLLVPSGLQGDMLPPIQTAAAIGHRGEPQTRLKLDRIRAAMPRIAQVFRDTPQYICRPLGEALDCELIVKLETANPVRSFKGRGTETMMARLADTRRSTSAVCASAGNLGLALAYSGQSRGVSVTVVAGASANRYKMDRIRALGATVRIVDGDFDDARLLARQMADSEGAFLVEDSQNLDTCEGAGTMALELIEGGILVDAVLIALGGGAMATGVGHVFKCLAPTVEIICVQPKGAPAMALSWRAKSVVQTDRIDTIADGVAGRCPIPAVLDDLLAVADHAPLVEENSIIAAMRMLYYHAGLIVEPSAALGVAAMLEDRAYYRGKRVVTIICGSNVVPADFKRWVIQQDDGSL